MMPTQNALAKERTGKSGRQTARFSMNKTNMIELMKLKNTEVMK